MNQKDRADLKFSIQKYHAKQLRERKWGNYELCNLANIEQIYLPFAMDDSKTYDNTGAEV